MHGVPPSPRHRPNPKPKNTATSWNLELSVSAAVVAFRAHVARLPLPWRGGRLCPELGRPERTGSAVVPHLVWFGSVPGRPDGEESFLSASALPSPAAAG